ncbi:helix-turn-helix transcriptional regulator [Trinickia mobilis]|uniref:helix-turn-helix transcriptional regulator n=1 Tax=Trinickia mobilis TaxID=2816356 RepID=UPI001A8FAF22|nr:helix-turn-helix transcriptional regulator [Trinickia mobilis]
MNASLRVGLVNGLPRTDIRRPGEAGRHVSLVLMLEGSGHYLMDGARQACLFTRGFCYLSCAHERFGGADYFPAGHLLKLAIFQYRTEWLDLLTPLLLERRAGAELYPHPTRRAWVLRMPMPPELRQLAQELLDDGIPEHPLDVLKVEGRALSALWRVAHDLSFGSGARAGEPGCEPGCEPRREPDSRRARAHPLTGRERRLLLDARAHIDKHCLEPLEVAGIGRVVGLGLHALQQGFQQLFGKSVYGYVLERRLEHAVQLIDESALPIKEIAWRCGFAHASHLARQFRRRYGVSPRAYRCR